MRSTDRSHLKVGVYVDGANIAMNGGYGMRYDVLREFATRDGAEVMRLNAYLSYDPKRADTDDQYRKGQHNFHSSLRDMGFKVIEKIVRWYTDEATGTSVPKANVDLDMAVDLLLQSQNLDRVILATGDGDFVRVVGALQNKGCRVEVMAFKNVSRNLRREADLFFSGYLIPNLIPTAQRDHARDQIPWGEVGSRVRGVCYSHSDKGFGFFRFLKSISPGLWITDTRNQESPYDSAFFHDSVLPEELNPMLLPSRNLIFEFELREAPDEGTNFQAGDIRVVDWGR
jgi:uncharacterized LabA/DUF88 family protein